jgi:hypothetical protein
MRNRVRGVLAIVGPWLAVVTLVAIDHAKRWPA